MNQNSKAHLKSIPQSEVLHVDGAPINKHSQKEKIKFPIKSFIKGVMIDSPIQRTDEAWMIENKYHKPYVNIDKSLFVKTKEEKRIAVDAKNEWNRTHKGYKTKTIKL